MSAGHVVDASVGIKLYVAEPFAERARDLFMGQPASRLHVPGLFFGECANILWKYVRRFGMPLADARRIVPDLRALDLQRTPTIELIDDALDIALAYEITAYDACYVALAARLAIPLVTADEALVRKFASAAYDVRWLGSLALPPAPSS